MKLRELIILSNALGSVRQGEAKLMYGIQKNLNKILSLLKSNKEFMELNIRLNQRDDEMEEAKSQCMIKESEKQDQIDEDKFNSLSKEISIKYKESDDAMNKLQESDISIEFHKFSIADCKTELPANLVGILEDIGILID